MSEAKQAYIARCLGGCGAIRFAYCVSDDDSADLKKDAAREVAKCIRRGYKVELVAVDVPRTERWKCTCEPSLDAPAKAKRTTQTAMAF